jgi:prepilin-type N-terminal cleavage/methylation domain-containing protein
MHAAKRRRQEGMTLLEIVIVTAILALAASGLTFSLGALSRTQLKSSAGKLVAAVRFAYSRAVVRGTTVRIRFEIPGGTFSIEEAKSGVTLARLSEKERVGERGEDGQVQSAVDPWAAAAARINTPDKPTLGSSPFAPIAGGMRAPSEGSAETSSESSSGSPSKSRYTNVALGRGVQFVRLTVPHEPEPVVGGEGAIHFFPGGRTEHGVVQLGDGREGVYSVEVLPLTGRARIYAEAYEPRELQDNPEDEGDDAVSEVDEP